MSYDEKLSMISRNMSPQQPQNSRAASFENSYNSSQSEVKQVDPNGTKDYNGKTSPLSIIAFILSLYGCLSFVGLILGIIDLNKKDGRKRALSMAAVIIGVIGILISLAIYQLVVDIYKFPKHLYSGLLMALA